MKSKKIICNVINSFLVLLGTFDLSFASEDGPEHYESELKGTAFREGKGLEVAEATKKAIGLKTLEVEEGLIKSDVHLSAQVYRVTKHEGGNSNLLFASIRLPAEEAKKLSAGMRIEGKDISGGSVMNLDSSTLRATGEMEILLELQASSGSVQVGDILEVSAVGKPGEPSSIIPRSALLETISGTFVYVPNGKYFFRNQVKVGAKSEDKVEITEGLYAGDEVVSEGVKALWLAELQATKGGVSCADGH